MTFPDLNTFMYNILSYGCVHVQDRLVHTYYAQSQNVCASFLVQTVTKWNCHLTYYTRDLSEHNMSSHIILFMKIFIYIPYSDRRKCRISNWIVFMFVLAETSITHLSSNVICLRISRDLEAWSVFRLNIR